MNSGGFTKGLMTVVIVLLLAVIVFLTKDNLPFGFTALSQISSSPLSFEGRAVKVRGEVVDALKIPFIDSRVYVIDDGTGQVSVTTNQDLPATGSEVAIIALVKNTASIGGQSLGFRLQEVKVLPEFALIF